MPSMRQDRATFCLIDARPYHAVFKVQKYLYSEEVLVFDIAPKPIEHVCFSDEMRYDPDFNFWGCAVCGKKYQAPQIVVPTIPRWKPWTYDVPRLCLPTNGYWFPELDYRC